MVQPKYSPEEALQRIKLMMEYDLSKTSTENKKVVLEQTKELTIDDIKNGKSVVKMGMKGPIVGKIQELLASAGYPDISKSGKIDNDFGSLTKGEVEKFQSEHKNDEGEPLQKDGEVGPETIKALLKRTESKEENSIFNCVKNYYADYESKLSTDLRNKIKYEYFQDYMSITRPILNTDVEGKYKENFFKDGKYELIRDGRWSDWKTGKYTQFNDSQESKWFCIGERKYGVDDLKPSPEDKTTTPTQPVSQQTQTASQNSLNPSEEQTQPATQQTQSVSNSTQDTPDPSKPQKLKPKDSPLGTTLKDTSIPKRSCVVYVNQLYEAFTRYREGFDPDQINNLRKYVQRCMDDHFPSGSRQGNWGITGLGGSETDQKLLKLSACPMKFVGRPNSDIVDAPAPSQSGPDSIFRLARKC